MLARLKKLGDIDAAPGQASRPVLELAAFLDLANIVFHVLPRPASRMGDERVLGKLASDLSEECQQLTGYALHVVLATCNYKRSHFAF